LKTWREIWNALMITMLHLLSPLLTDSTKV
jgi:hypothetical protein